MDRTAVEKNLSLRDPPQAENPALQDSIFILINVWISAIPLVLVAEWLLKSTLRQGILIPMAVVIFTTLLSEQPNQINDNRGKICFEERFANPVSNLIITQIRM